jgi:hypothetical protein
LRDQCGWRATTVSTVSTVDTLYYTPELKGRPVMAGSLLEKIVRGGDQRDRTTRFHDENDRFIGWSEMRRLPHALNTWLLRRVFGELPELPWWPYPAIERIAEILSPNSVVLEYGTGASTIWMARRVRRIYGIEDSPEWCERVRKLAGARRLDNLVLTLRDSTRYPNCGNHCAAFNEEFAGLPEASEPAFDLVVVDGAVRWRCIEVALPKIKQGGYLYLDNSDGDKDWCYYVESGRAKVAQALLDAAAVGGEGTVERLRGLCPATPHASEGMLFRKS